MIGAERWLSHPLCDATMLPADTLNAFHQGGWPPQHTIPYSSKPATNRAWRLCRWRDHKGSDISQIFYVCGKILFFSFPCVRSLLTAMESFSLDVAPASPSNLTALNVSVSYDELVKHPQLYFQVFLNHLLMPWS